MLPVRTLAVCLMLAGANAGRVSGSGTLQPPSGCPDTPFGVCNGRGSCVNQECECRLGYKGSACETSTMDGCPRQCSGHGSCDQTSSVCTCESGYDGSACDIVSGCEELGYCNGHGSCQGGAACKCDAGWGLDDCSERIGCTHGCSGRGKCVLDPTNATFKCVCDPPFGGPYCGNAQVGPCPGTCSGHGVCIENEARCKCRPGFTGPKCDVVLNLCNRSCNHGQCMAGRIKPPPFSPKTYARTYLVAQAPPTCRCHQDYEGSSCGGRLAETLPCASRAHCSGHGICQTSTGVCTCDVGFTGRICDQVDPETACPDGCTGHGTCVHDGTRARCECWLGWKGEICDQSSCITGENGLVCSGRGLCLDVITPNRTYYACECDPGYSGDGCEESPLPCPANCSSNGVCNEGVCICHTGYSGPACAISNSTGQDGICCPYNCSDNGVCDMDACRCNCNQEWAGPACNVFESGDDNA